MIQERERSCRVDIRNNTVPLAKIGGKRTQSIPACGIVAMIAIFADQHLSEQRGRGQTASDHPLRRRMLMERAAGPAGVFRAPCADHPNPCRNPVQRLADALPGGLQGFAAACAGRAFQIEDHLLARQVIGQSLAIRLPLDGRIGDDRRTFPQRGNIPIQIFQGQFKLVGVHALGFAAELHMLKLSDERKRPA